MARPTETITEGLTCLRCYSVVFTINALLKHIQEEPSHQYWKYGEGDGVVFLRYLVDIKKQLL